MPILNNVKTLNSEESWKSPDGKITSFNVLLDVEGKQFKTQTYSKDIAQVGWSGDVETYDRKGHTFVKQPQREDSQFAGRSYGGGAKSYSKPTSDQFTMYLSYAKDVVVACIERGDKMGVEEAISTVIAQGNRLYEARPGGSPTDAEPSAQESLDALGIKGKAIDNFEEEDPWAGMDLAEIPSLQHGRLRYQSLSAVSRHVKIGA